jgi:uncharacterized Zn finger protein
MRSWNRFEDYRRPAKKPPPEHGIRIKKSGTTWWGQRWIEALESVLRGDAGRLSRGKTYARAGRTHDLLVKGGRVTARVTGTRPDPYAVSIAVAELGPAVWAKAIAAMAAKAQFSAELLAGRMPEAIDEAFRAAGASLFPTQRSDLDTDCNCPDSGDPCKHIAATHYVLGAAFDRDPFLLFELRGKTKDQVLEALRAARGGPAEAPRKRGSRGKAEKPSAHETTLPSPEVPTVTLAGLSASDYDKPRASLPALHFTFEVPSTTGAVLRQLGAPPEWQGEGSPAEALAPLVRAAAESARRMAMAEPDEDAPEPLPQSAPEHEASQRTPRPAPERKPSAGTRRRQRS